MQEILLSIIIPIYNIEKYVEQCLDSVKVQVFGKKNIEILLIDDGSKDDSGKICDNYVKQCENFIAIHKENGGLSAARNTGIYAARGRFLLFLDGDDFLCEGSIDRIIKELIDAPQTDVLIGRYVNYDLFSRKYKECGYHLNKEIIKGKTGNELLSVLLEGRTYEWYAWLNIVRKQYLTDHHFYFKEGVVFEDVIWTPDVLFSAQNVEYMDEPFYVYVRNRSDSITRKFSEKNYMDKWNALEYTEQFCINHPITDVIKNRLWGNLNLIYTSLLFESWNFRREKRRDLQKKLDKYKYIYRYTDRKYQQILYKLWNLIGIRGVSLILYIRAEWVRRRRQ